MDLEQYSKDIKNSKIVRMLSVNSVITIVIVLVLMIGFYYQYKEYSILRNYFSPNNPKLCPSNHMIDESQVIYTFKPTLKCERPSDQLERKKCINCQDECPDYNGCNLQKHICYWSYSNPYANNKTVPNPLYTFNINLPFNVTQHLGGICDEDPQSAYHMYCNLSINKFYIAGIYYPVSVKGYVCIPEDLYVNNSITLSSPRVVSDQGNAVIRASSTIIPSPYVSSIVPNISLIYSTPSKPCTSNTQVQEYTYRFKVKPNTSKYDMKLLIEIAKATIKNVTNNVCIFNNQALPRPTIHCHLTNNVMYDIEYTLLFKCSNCPSRKSIDSIVQYKYAKSCENEFTLWRKYITPVCDSYNIIITQPEITNCLLPRTNYAFNTTLNITLPKNCAASSVFVIVITNNIITQSTISNIVSSSNSIICVYLIDKVICTLTITSPSDYGITLKYLTQGACSIECNNSKILTKVDVQSSYCNPVNNSYQYNASNAIELDYDSAVVISSLRNVKCSNQMATPNLNFSVIIYNNNFTFSSGNQLELTTNIINSISILIVSASQPVTCIQYTLTSYTCIPNSVPIFPIIINLTATINCSICTPSNIFQITSSLNTVPENCNNSNDTKAYRVNVIPSPSLVISPASIVNCNSLNPNTSTTTFNVTIYDRYVPEGTRLTLITNVTGALSYRVYAYNSFLSCEVNDTPNNSTCEISPMFYFPIVVNFTVTVNCKICNKTNNFTIISYLKVPPSNCSNPYNSSNYQINDNPLSVVTPKSVNCTNLPSSTMFNTQIIVNTPLSITSNIIQLLVISTNSNYVNITSPSLLPFCVVLSLNVITCNITPPYAFPIVLNYSVNVNCNTSCNNNYTATQFASISYNSSCPVSDNYIKSSNTLVVKNPFNPVISITQLNQPICTSSQRGVVTDHNINIPLSPCAAPNNINNTLISVLISAPISSSLNVVSNPSCIQLNSITLLCTYNCSNINNININVQINNLCTTCNTAMSNMLLVNLTNTGNNCINNTASASKISIKSSSVIITNNPPPICNGSNVIRITGNITIYNTYGNLTPTFNITITPAIPLLSDSFFKYNAVSDRSSINSILGVTIACNLLYPGFFACVISNVSDIIYPYIIQYGYNVLCSDICSTNGTTTIMTDFGFNSTNSSCSSISSYGNTVPIQIVNPLSWNNRVIEKCPGVAVTVQFTLFANITFPDNNGAAEIYVSVDNNAIIALSATTLLFCNLLSSRTFVCIINTNVPLPFLSVMSGSFTILCASLPVGTNILMSATITDYSYCNYNSTIKSLIPAY